MGLGDDLMITGIIEQEHRKHPDKQIVIGDLKKNLVFDSIIYLNNPNITPMTRVAITFSQLLDLLDLTKQIGTAKRKNANTSTLHVRSENVQSRDLFAIGHSAPAISSPIARRMRGSRSARKNPAPKISPNLRLDGTSIPIPPFKHQVKGQLSINQSKQDSAIQG